MIFWRDVTILWCLAFIKYAGSYREYIFCNFAGMKKVLGIFSVIILSLVFIATGAGVSVATCSHTGRMEVAQMAEAQGAHGCYGMKSCMVVKTVRLAPGTIAEHSFFNFTQPLTAILPVIITAGIPYFPLPAHTSKEYVALSFSPPRESLRRLRVLRL